MTSTIRIGAHLVREVRPDDEPALAELLHAASDYVEAATGLPPGPADVQSLHYSLPDGADFDDKVLLVVESPDGEVVGLLDAVARHPDPESCSVGLFLIHPAHRGRGLGAAVADVLLWRAREEGLTRVLATVPVGWSAGERFALARSFAVAPDIAAPADAVGNRNPGPRETPTRRLEYRAP
jgi:GNAT superfamily N-acetyltransferase